MKKIMLIHNIISPTRTKLFNELYKRFLKDGYKFKIIFTSETEGNRARNTSTEIKKFKFPYKILNSKQLTNKTKTDQNYFHINKNIIKEIEKENPDIIIHAGRAGLSVFQLCRRAKRHKKKFILRSGSTAYEKSRRRTITKPLVKRLVKNSTSFRSYGTRASEYLESLGVNPNKIFKLYNTVDIEFFIKQAEELKPQKTEIKKKLGIKEKNIILFVGQLIKRKGVFELLEGFNLFKQKNELDIGLVFVGSGIEEKNLNKIVKEKNINNVYFEGYKQKNEISKYFSITDIFTLPSHEEVWGLSINEAMCFGLPILTTKFVGAGVDLVRNENGVIIDQISSKEIMRAIDTIMKKGLIVRNDSKERIEEFGVKNVVKNIYL